MVPMLLAEKENKGGGSVSVSKIRGGVSEIPIVIFSVESEIAD